MLQVLLSALFFAVLQGPLTILDICIPHAA